MRHDFGKAEKVVEKRPIEVGDIVLTRVEVFDSKHQKIENIGYELDIDTYNDVHAGKN